jgi:hypothetical protein
MMKRRQWIWIAAGVLAALFVLRAALPWLVTHYANRALGGMPGYAGTVADVDISLIRGAYTVHGIKIFKKEGSAEIPFIDISQVDFSVAWGALLHGAIVGEAVVRQPVCNFIHKVQTGEKVNWAAKVKEMLPVRINRFEIRDGKVTFYDFTKKPDVSLELKQLQVVATNFANVEDSGEALPAALEATGVSIGDGRLTLKMRLNPLQAVPDLDMDLSFENINMPALNDFFRAYGKIDVERGTLSVYSEMAVKDGKVKGYIKPVARDVEILDVKTDDQNPVTLAWQAIVAFVTEIFKNKPKQQLATQIPLSGDVSNIKTSVWAALWNIYQNGFVQAFSKSTNSSIDFGDVGKQEKPSDRSRRK